MLALIWLIGISITYFIWRGTSEINNVYIKNLIRTMASVLLVSVVPMGACGSTFALVPFVYFAAWEIGYLGVKASLIVILFSVYFALAWPIVYLIGLKTK